MLSSNSHILVKKIYILNTYYSSHSILSLSTYSLLNKSTDSLFNTSMYLIYINLFAIYVKYLRTLFKILYVQTSQHSIFL